MQTTGTQNNSSVLFDQYYKRDAVDWRGNEEAVRSLVKSLEELPPAGDDALIHALDLAPTSGVPIEEVLALIEDLSETLKRLNQNDYSSEELMRLILRIAQNARFDYVRGRLLSLQANKNELLLQAQKTADEAEEMKRGAAATLALSVVQAVATIVATVVALDSVKTSFDEIKGADKVAKDSADNLLKIADGQNEQATRKIEKGFWYKDDESGVIKRVDAGRDPGEFEKGNQKLNTKLAMLEGNKFHLQTEQQEILNKSQAANSKCQSYSAIGQGVSGGVGGAANAAGQFSGSESTLDRAEGERHAAAATEDQAEVENWTKARDQIIELIKSLIEFNQRVEAAEADQLGAVKA
jgi:hypothetical protein